MKTIKIFLASSEELDYDRMVFGNLVRRLDDMYEKRGIRIKLFEWEDYDSAYNDKRKQDEYNEYVCQSDIFLALFHKKAGEFTIEEFDKASEQFRATASPKVYTYCKDLKPGEVESKELKEFKDRLFNEMGHYWCRYDNRESLQFQFVMQLQLVESNRMDDVKVENGVVTINGLPVAKMDNLKFAACNDKYQEMSEKIALFPDLIVKARILTERYPEDEDLRDNLQQKLNELNKLKKEFAELQQFFFDTAKQVARYQGEFIDSNIRDAITAFNEGRVKEAIYIFERSEASKPSLEEYKLSKDLFEQNLQNQISYINQLVLWAAMIMADASQPIYNRINDAEKKYEEAILIATTVVYDKKKFVDFLADYVNFLYRFAHYDKALKYEQEIITILESEQDNHQLYIADSYNMMGLIYKKKTHYKESLEYHKKALAIRKKYLGDEHLDTADSYNNIGSIYRYEKDYSNALDFYKKALFIKIKKLGEKHLYTADSYNNLGLIYYLRGDYSQALLFFRKALAIYEILLGEDQLDTAISYNNIGNVYYQNGEYSLALEYHKKALEIRKNNLGDEHPETAMSYYNIGLIYNELGHDDKLPLENFKKALKLFEIIELHGVLSSSQSYYKSRKKAFAVRDEKLKTPDQYQVVISRSIYFNLLDPKETSFFLPSSFA